MTTSTPYITALITLNLPGEEQPTQVTVKLLPTDKVDTTSGRKKLGDCTLAELAHYADELEAAVLVDYASIRLGEWTQHENHQLEIALLGEAETSTPITVADGLAYVMVPEGSAAAPTAELTATSPGEEIVPVEELPTPDDMPDTTPIPAENEGEPAIHVAEPEQVFEEREAGSTPAGVTSVLTDKPKTRIAGLRRPLNHSTWAATDILINENAFRDAQAHALSSLDREVAGVLIGPPPEKQPDGRYVVHVTDTIIAKHTRMHGASVTYTPESWRYLNDKLAELYPDESAVMVGWYHTHPGFGIFLSGMDLFIHQNFFTQVWHVALVLDPVARTSGFFCWDRPKTRVDRYDFPWPYWAHKGW